MDLFVCTAERKLAVPDNNFAIIFIDNTIFYLLLLLKYFFQANCVFWLKLLIMHLN